MIFCFNRLTDARELVFALLDRAAIGGDFALGRVRFTGAGRLRGLLSSTLQTLAAFLQLGALLNLELPRDIELLPFLGEHAFERLQSCAELFEVFGDLLELALDISSRVVHFCKFGKGYELFAQGPPPSIPKLAGL